jgi:Fe-S oxidoreductase
MRIGLFIPCYIDAFFPQIGIATLELLERFGHDVDYPRDQTCCGQPMANSGFNADAALPKWAARRSATMSRAGATDPLIRDLM